MSAFHDRRPNYQAVVDHVQFSQLAGALALHAQSGAEPHARRAGRLAAAISSQTGVPSDKVAELANQRRPRLYNPATGQSA